MPTSGGMLAFTHYMAPYAPPRGQPKAAGAFIIAKSTMSELEGGTARKPSGGLQRRRGQSYNQYDPRANDDGTRFWPSPVKLRLRPSRRTFMPEASAIHGGSIEGPSNANMMSVRRPTGRISATDRALSLIDTPVPDKVRCRCPIMLGAMEGPRSIPTIAHSECHRATAITPLPEPRSAQGARTDPRAGLYTAQTFHGKPKAFAGSEPESARP